MITACARAAQAHVTRIPTLMRNRDFPLCRSAVGFWPVRSLLRISLHSVWCFSETPFCLLAKAQAASKFLTSCVSEAACQSITRLLFHLVRGLGNRDNPGRRRASVKDPGVWSEYPALGKLHVASTGFCISRAHNPLHIFC